MNRKTILESLFVHLHHLIVELKGYSALVFIFFPKGFNEILTIHLKKHLKGILAS